jgi:hypothetical protein
MTYVHTELQGVQEAKWYRKEKLKKKSSGVNTHALRFLVPNLRKEIASDIPGNKGRPLTLYMIPTVPW